MIELTKHNNNLIMYHNQASKDPFAMVPDLEPAIISTTIKLIKEAYTEWLDDLMLEAQEAY